MVSGWRTMLMVVVMAAMTVPVQAQQGGGGRGRQGGGFGGGFPGGGRGGELMMLTMPEVQKELKITDEQKGLIEDMMADLRPQGGGGNPGDFRNLSDEERNKRFEEMRAQAEERSKKAETALKDILDDTQFARYSELKMQRQGLAALGTADVAAKLELTADQQAKIKSIREGDGQNRGGNFGNFRDASPEEREKMMTEMRQRREKQDTDTLAVLTPDQKAKWEKLQGAKFEFPQRGFGPGGQGQGGQGGRRPGGNRPSAE